MAFRFFDFFYALLYFSSRRFLFARARALLSSFISSSPSIYAIVFLLFFFRACAQMRRSVRSGAVYHIFMLPCRALRLRLPCQRAAYEMLCLPRHAADAALLLPLLPYARYVCCYSVAAILCSRHAAVPPPFSSSPLFAAHFYHPHKWRYGHDHVCRRRRAMPPEAMRREQRRRCLLPPR